MKNKSLFWGSLLLAMIAFEVAEAKSLALENTSVTRFQQEEIEAEEQAFDTNGSPILGVSVIVKGIHRGVITDEEGCFILKADADAVLVFRFSGHQTQEVALNGCSFISVQMKASVQELGEVTAASTGVKRQIKGFAGTVNVTSASQIKELAVPIVGDAMRSMPGVNYIDEDGRGLRPGIGLCGIEPDRNSNTLVVTGGKIPIGQGYPDMGGYYMMPADAIESVEVIKGASPALYGSGSIGGVVNIITKKGAACPYIGINLQYGNHNALNIGVETVGNTNEGAMNYYVSFHRRQGDGFRKSRSRYNIDDLTANVIAKVGDKDERRFLLNSLTEYSETPGGLSQAQWEQDPEQSVNPHDFPEVKRSSTAISYKRSFDETNSLATSVYGSYLKRDWWLDNRNAIASRRKSTVTLRDAPTVSLSSDYERTNTLFDKENELLADICLHTDVTHEVSVAGNEMGKKAGKITANSADTAAVVEEYVFDEFHITDKLNINPGARYTFANYDKEDYYKNSWDNRNEDIFVYSLGLLYKFSEQYRAYATYSEGYKTPQIRSASETNGDFDAETFSNYEIGLRTCPIQWLEVELAAYILNFNHKIFRESGLPNNGGKALHRGIGVNGAIYPVEGLKLCGSGAIQRVAIGYGMNRGNRVPYAPRYIATAGAKYQCGVGEGTLTTNVYGNFVSSQFLDLANILESSANGNVGLIPKFFLPNATANYSYEQWNFNPNVLNLLNRKHLITRHNAWGGVISAATINVLGGVGHQF